jgi:hypothetical protein
MLIRRTIRQTHPKASIAEDMVFAVYIPPQAPAPGQRFEYSLEVLRSNRVIEFFPNASNAETI